VPDASSSSGVRTSGRNEWSVPEYVERDFRRDLDCGIQWRLTGRFRGDRERQQFADSRRLLFSCEPG